MKECTRCADGASVTAGAVGVGRVILGIGTSLNPFSLRPTIVSSTTYRSTKWRLRPNTSRILAEGRR